ncbi:protein of unknown function [Mariniphaga anaerophila]|uniref:DUF4861 domain-containing protein n=1 Tax=Mariniphaga anaerophila TaxID=1484053 RepID=A0A1M5ASU7_9BACT|nr:DUF4861 domain-containing protein [Mariniphaga anaerophila]SHF33216.1 protein of unknown function [Mariniphaga anaerophila]
MKARLFIAFILVGLLSSCGKQAGLSFQNPQNVERPDEVVVLTKAELVQKTGLAEGQFPLFKNADNSLVPFQLDDMNNDGNWDEVALLLDFAPGETKKITVEFSDGTDYPPVFEKRTNLRLGIKQEDGSYKEVDSYRALPCSDGFKVIAQGESVNWENDKIGFRNYFDCRNVKDLFGKRMPKMIIDKIHTPEMGSYHDLADWGMDVLHCGSSLGSGGIALLKNDSLYRLGSTDVYEYQKLTEGPVRSVFELRYKGWEVDGDMLEAVEKISIYPGKYWFESDVTVTGCPAGSQIVTGIVTSHLKREPFDFQTGSFQCVGTHDVQSLNNDELGMAVIVPLAEAGKIGRTTDINFFKLGYETVPEKGFSNIISETCYIGQKCASGQPAKHYFFSVWGLDKDQWKTEEGFKKYIAEEAEKLSDSISFL